jgi:hypothetical protein
MMASPHSRSSVLSVLSNPRRRPLAYDVRGLLLALRVSVESPKVPIARETIIDVTERSFPASFVSLATRTPILASKSLSQPADVRS